MATSAIGIQHPGSSEKLGIPIQKLRRWDEQGVLVARRTDGGHRRYSRELIDRLAGLRCWLSTTPRSTKELATVTQGAGRKAPHHPAAARKREPLPRPGRDLARSDLDHRRAGPLHLPQHRRARHLRARAQGPDRALLLRFRSAAPRTSPTAASCRRCASTARSRTTSRTSSPPTARTAGSGSTRASSHDDNGDVCRHPRHRARHHRAAPRRRSASSTSRLHDSLTDLPNRLQPAAHASRPALAVGRRRRAAVPRHRPLQVRQRQLRPPHRRPADRRRGQRAARR